MPASLPTTTFSNNDPNSHIIVLRYNEDRHWFDPTEIFRDLGRRKKEAMAKMAFYMLSFFYYLYRMILALIN